MSARWRLLILLTVSACRQAAESDVCDPPEMPLSSYCRGGARCGGNLEQAKQAVCQYAPNSGYDIYANDCGGHTLIFPGRKWTDLGGLGEHFDAEDKFVGAYSWSDEISPGCSETTPKHFGTNCRVTGEPVMELSCASE